MLNFFYFNLLWYYLNQFFNYYLNQFVLIIIKMITKKNGKIEHNLL